MIVQHAGVQKWIRISQFRFAGVKQQYFLYILCHYDRDRSSNPRDYEVISAQLKGPQKNQSELHLAYFSVQAGYFHFRPVQLPWLWS